MNDQDKCIKRAVKTVSGVVAVIALLCLLWGSFYTIDQRERGVILRNGEVIGVAKPGLSFKLPIFDRIVKMTMETQRVTFTEVHSYSRDQQPAVMSISVNFRATEDKVAELYSEFGSADAYADRILSPRVNAHAKIVFGQFNAVTAIQERGRLNIEIEEQIKNEASGPMFIEAVQIDNIDFSEGYEQSIEQRMLAEVEVQKLRQNAEREKVQAEIVVTKATAEANAVRQKAMAEAEAITLRGDAEAEAIAARGAALGNNPMLIDLVKAEKWDGKLPTTMLPDGTLPMLSVKKHDAKTAQ